MLHETELQQADERHAQRYAQQCEELRQQLEKEKEELRQREHELAKQRQANKLTLYTTSVYFTVQLIISCGASARCCLSVLNNNTVKYHKGKITKCLTSLP